MRQHVEYYILKLQGDIIGTLEKLGSNVPPFKRDSWLRLQGGCGLSCVFQVPP